MTKLIIKSAAETSHQFLKMTMFWHFYQVKIPKYLSGIKKHKNRAAIQFLEGLFTNFCNIHDKKKGRKYDSVKALPAVSGLRDIGHIIPVVLTKLM